MNILLAGAGNISVPVFDKIDAASWLLGSFGIICKDGEGQAQGCKERKNEDDPKGVVI
jgi:hypothetical protein